MKNRDFRPILALTAGDPTGIGPEMTARILSGGACRDIADILLIGDSRVIGMGMKQAGVSFDLAVIDEPEYADFSADAIPIIDLVNMDPGDFALGRPDPEVGRKVGQTLSDAVDLAKRGGIHGLCFAPLHKKAMFDGGWRFKDEHQLFAHLLEFDGIFREMNVLDGQWMSRVTSHVSLREALDLVTPERIGDALHLTDTMLRRAGIENPRIAVAALNPHGGEGGLFGREEIEIIRPAVEAAQQAGIACEGPYPSDTVYLRAFAGDYDSVLAMYHDQGQIATKLRGFNRGVTVTAGLPIIFTTPAHGTAHDIVGRGVADIGAFDTAIRLAAQLATAQYASQSDEIEND